MADIISFLSLDNYCTNYILRSLFIYIMKITNYVTLLIVTSCNVTSSAFVGPRRVVQGTSTLHGWMDAFKNDESLGKPQNAGLTNGPKYNENVTINGKPVKAVVGQKVSDVAAAARAKIK